MNKGELVKAVMDETGMTKKKSEEFVNALVEVVESALKKGEDVKLIGFGTFSTRKRAKRNGVNPQTGKKITIPARTVVFFKPGKELKEKVS